MIPTNEQGVVALFSRLADEMGYEFKDIGTHCPDVILEKDKRIVRGEFEYRAKTFRTHKHNPDDVDLIICWEDDWPDSPVPVLCLETYVTLARRTEETKPALWQRFFLFWRDVIMYVSGLIREIAISQAKDRACPICGGTLHPKCSYDRSIRYSDGGGKCLGTARFQCRSCNYVESKTVSYHATKV